MAQKSTKRKQQQTEQPQLSAQAKRAARKQRGRVKLSRAAKIILVAIGCAAMILSVSAMACSGIINQSQNKEDYKLTGGVAATVDGVSITEDTVTKQIMSTRTSGGYDTDEKWAQYLVDNNLTPESYRESVIDSLARQYLLTAAEKEYGIEVSDEDVDKAWDDACKNYDSEEAFEQQLKMFGFTKDTYKEQLKSSLAQTKLKEKVAPEKKPSDDEIVSYVNENLGTYNDARRSKNILFKVDSDATDEEKAKVKKKAQEVLDKINSGELSFDDAVEKYSEDAGSKDSKGDVGWDKLTSFVSEYQDALSQLSKGQVSGIVESTYGYHIIKCTDYFHIDDKVTSIDQVPKKMRTYVSNVIKTQNQSTAYSEWMDKYVKKADIKINDMPSDVPYNVSLDGVTPSTGSASATGAGTDAETSDSGSADN